MNLGTRLRQIRKQSGLSQAQLAKILHISRQSISKWENDLSSPDVEMLLKLSSYYKVSIDEIVDNPLREQMQESNALMTYINHEDRKESSLVKTLERYEGYFILMLLILCCAIAPLGLIFIIFVMRWNRRTNTLKYVNYGASIIAFIYNVITLWLCFH